MYYTMYILYRQCITLCIYCIDKLDTSITDLLVRREKLRSLFRY